jgi:hypothetical protein
MVLIALLVLSLILATLIPQIPSQAVSDPQAWLAFQSGLFGQPNELIRGLGLFDIYHAPWFHVLLALMGLSLFVRLVESAELAWLATGRKRWQSGSFAFWGRNAPQVRLSSFASPASAQTRLRDFFTQRAYWWIDIPDMETPNAVIGRRAFVFWVRPVAFGALLVALLGLLIVGSWGWQNRDWHSAPGDSQEVGHGTPYSLRLDAFDLQLDQDGRLLDYSSNVTWLEGDAVVGQDTVGVGRPATLRGVAVRQVGYLPSLKVRAWDAEARPLVLQVAGEERAVPGEVEILFPSSEAQPLLLIPSHDLFLAFAFVPLCPEGRPLVQVSLLRNGGTEQQSLDALYESGSLTVEGVTVEVDLAYRAVLGVDFRPGMGIVVVSMALAVLALAVGWTVPPRLAWLAIGQGEEGATLQVLVPAGVRGRRWLLRLGDQLREALADGD